jgi:hypothetical protein
VLLGASVTRLAVEADLPDDMSVIPEADYDHLLVDA